MYANRRIIVHYPLVIVTVPIHTLYRYNVSRDKVHVFVVQCKCKLFFAFITQIGIIKELLIFVFVYQKHLKYFNITVGILIFCVI